MNTVAVFSADLLDRFVTEPMATLLSRGYLSPLHTPCRLACDLGPRRCRFRWQAPRSTTGSFRPPAHIAPSLLVSRGRAAQRQLPPLRAAILPPAPGAALAGPPPGGRRVGRGTVPSDDRGADGAAEELAPLVNPEFLEDVRQVGGNGSPADLELGCHLGVPQAERDLPDDLALAHGHRL